MKQKSLFISLSLLIFTFSFAQVNLVTNAPTGNGATTQVRAPNGLSSHSFLRASSLLLASDLTVIPNGTSITSFGFVTTGGANVPVTGTLTVYMKNSTDTSFTLGTDWATIITGMTTVYSGTYTVPASATNVDLNLTTSFAYTGGSVYVAYDFVRTGTAASSAATYSANNTLAGGCVSASNSTAAPTTLGATAFRPVMRLGYPNPNSNDMSVDGVNSLGNVATSLGLPVPISAVVTNKSNTTLNNISVTASLTGVNTYNDLQTVATLAPGASTTVNFANWTPTALGSNVLNISVPSDQVNSNNSLNFNTATTCYTSGVAQNPISYAGAVGFNTASGIISTPVQNSVASTIESVNVIISNNTASVGNNVFGVLLDNTGAILAQSPDLMIANSDLNIIKTFTFPTPVAVAANQIVHIGLGQTANTTTGYYPVGSYTNTTLTTVYNTCAVTGGTLAPLTSNLGQMGIEANYTGTCALGVNDVEFANNKLTVYPNPTSTVLNIKLESFNDNFNFEVCNVIGQTVVPSQKIVNSISELNVSTLTKGVYFLKINSGKQSNTVKFTVDR